ncbi:MAG: hypothetical protein EZS28_022328, partial [Streblomastix strix]
DKLNTGYILQSRFRSCADKTGIELTDEEFAFVVANFCDDQQNHPKQVHYTLWSDVMDEVFTTKGFDYHPQMDPKPWIPPSHKGISTTMTPQEEKYVRTAIDRFHKLIIDRRVFLKPHLKDYDRLNSGHITASQFKSSCGTLGLTFSCMDEQNAVIEKFSDSLGFLYYDFVNACETGKY